MLIEKAVETFHWNVSLMMNEGMAVLIVLQF
jgi:hypothetical protein